MSDRADPQPPRVPETAVVLGTAAVAAAALVAQAVWSFGAGWGDWVGLAGAAAAIVFVGAAVLAGAPRGWRWVGATVCAHLGLHPWLAYEATRHPVTALSLAVVALTAWVALGVARTATRRRLQGWPAALFFALLVGLSALVRPDLPGLTLPLGLLALWLARAGLKPGSDLLVLPALAAVAVAAGIVTRYRLFDLESLWAAGGAAPLADFVRVNAVTATAGLSALALLGKPAWRQAALLYVPMLVFAALTLWTVPQLPGAQALHLPLLPLLAIAFAVLLARALDALPAIRPRDDLGKTAALILGLVYIAHLLAVETGQAPPVPTRAI